jgi:hypothetical protein
MNTAAVSAFKSRTAPGFKATATKQTENLLPKDSYDPAERQDESNRDWGRTAAWVGLGALSLAPNLVQAKDVGKVVTEHLPGLTDVFSQSETQVGDYKLTFKGADINVSPRFRGLKPGVRLRGDFLRTEFAKTESIGDGWSKTQGLRGILHGQVSTHNVAEAQVNLEAFSRWNGTVGKGVNSTFEVSGGTYYDAMNSTASVGVSARQEFKGGNFEIAGQPLSWNVEGNQSVRQIVKGDNGSGSNLNWNYEVLVGVRRDYPMQIFGKNANVSVVLGPEIAGNQQDHFKVAPKLKVRVRY